MPSCGLTAKLQRSFAMNNHLRIACVQSNPTVGDLQGNLDIVRRYREIYCGKADLVVFTECFVTGYPLGDLVLRPGFLRDVRVALSDFAREVEGSEGPAVLVGAPREGGALPFNSAYLIDTDGSVQVTDKARLPNSEVYDEVRTFTPGTMPRPLTFRGVKIGVPICEDFWHGDVTRALVEEGAELLIVPNGSHFRVGKEKVRIELAHETVRRLGIPVIYVNQVGGQDELVFDGGSFAMSRNGDMLTRLAFEEASFRTDLIHDDKGSNIEVSVEEMYSNPHPLYPDDLAATYQAMVVGLRDYVRKSGFRKGVVIGMSGGLDSALTAAVAVDALSPDKVLLVRMPSAYTGSASMDDAEEAARMLGCRMETVSIAPAVDAYKAMMTPLFMAHGMQGEDTTEENIQARARGMTLMAISNKLGLMLLTTGNKSEMSVGYATLYGDMCGGFSVLKDCWKTLAFQLARWRNAGRPLGMLGPDGPVMPDAIHLKPPSAELKPGQTDEASLGSYEHLDAVLRLMVEEQNTPARASEMATAELRSTAMAAASDIKDREGRQLAEQEAQTITVGRDYAERIAGLVRAAQYKRRQSPPGVVLTNRDYGQGWRFPIAGTYKL
jgi:NAD+ synthase